MGEIAHRCSVSVRVKYTGGTDEEKLGGCSREAAHGSKCKLCTLGPRGLGWTFNKVEGTERCVPVTEILGFLFLASFLRMFPFKITFKKGQWV